MFDNRSTSSTPLSPFAPAVEQTTFIDSSDSNLFAVHSKTIHVVRRGTDSLAPGSALLFRAPADPFIVH